MFASVTSSIGDAASMVGSMTWEILWALVLGFFIAAVVQSVVRKSEINRLLPNARPKSLATATGLGIASSSCSYAAVALSRSLFRKGANFTAAITFMLASTNLVVELGLILWLLMGWQFALAEYVGGALMIVMLAITFRLTLTKRMVEDARSQADRAVAGSMEGHAAMDMSVHQTGNVFRRIVSRSGWKAIADNFVMEWAAVLRDIAIGLVIAGCIGAWVPEHFWKSLFLTDHPTLSKIWGPIIGPVVAILSFVCSIGNVPLAAVLWNGGISFGGVISFIFADLIIVPILVIYRKYYGFKVAAYLFASLWFVMSTAGILVNLLFDALGITPNVRNIAAESAHVTWNYTTFLNIGFLALAASLLFTFWRMGSWPMLKAMGGEADQPHDHCHHDSAEVIVQEPGHTAHFEDDLAHHHHH